MFKYHSDITHDTATDEILKEVNAEYDILFKQFKDIKRNANGETYETTNNETIDEFKNVINAIVELDSILVELIGEWLWISGETKKHKETLKMLGFKFSAKKSAWYYHKREKFYRYSKKNLSLQDLREKFGTEIINSKKSLTA